MGLFGKSDKEKYEEYINKGDVLYDKENYLAITCRWLILKSFYNTKFCILYTIKYAVNSFPILKYCIFFIILQAEN